MESCVVLVVVEGTVVHLEEVSCRHETVEHSTVLPRCDTYDLNIGVLEDLFHGRSVASLCSADDRHTVVFLCSIGYLFGAGFVTASHIDEVIEIECGGIFCVVLPGRDPVIGTDDQILAAHSEDGVEWRRDERDDLVVTGHIIRGDLVIDVDVVDVLDSTPVPGGLGRDHGVHLGDVLLVDDLVVVRVVHVVILVLVTGRLGCLIIYELLDLLYIVGVDIVVEIGISEDGQIGVRISIYALFPTVVVEDYEGSDRYDGDYCHHSHDANRFFIHVYPLAR